jgi:Beta-lactamase enzyme family
VLYGCAEVIMRTDSRHSAPSARGLLIAPRTVTAFTGILALALTTATLATAPALGAPSAEISAASVPSELVYGATLSVTGRIVALGAGMGGVPLALQATPYPYRRLTTVAHTTSAADGSFTFADVRPDRDSRLRVIDEGSTSIVSQRLGVIVDPRAAIREQSLGPGRARLSVRVGHTPQRRASSVSARWFVAARGTHTFHLAAMTPTRELSGGVTYASATIDPPSKRFSYRVCLNPSWEDAMGTPTAHHECPQRDFTSVSMVRGVEYQGEGRGIPIRSYPSSNAIAAATRFLDTRAGRTSFAVVDSQGRLSGARLREHFQTASVVKVMMLVAYLQMLDAQHRGLSAADTSLLYPMIHVSDNNAASAVLAIVGGASVARVARESGMSDYAPGVGWWAFSQTSAADQARFFFALPRLIPGQFYGYARGLMSGIEPSQSWGIPPVARPRWEVFFKTGALPSEGLFNEVARLERPGVTFTIAVFTTGDPSMSYGEQTIQGVASALLAHPP